MDVSMADYITYTAQYIPGNGQPGETGPMLVYRGLYDRNDQGEYEGHQTYYGTEERRDVVYHGNKWYMALKVTGGEFSNKEPGTSGGSAYWSPFEGNFSNVATGLLMSEKAYLTNAIVRYLETYDPDSSAKITAERNYLILSDTNGAPKFSLTGNNVSLGTPINVYPLSSLHKLRHFRNSSGSETIYEELVTDRDVAQGDTIDVPSFTLVTTLDNNASSTTTMTVTLYKGSISQINRTASTSNVGNDTKTASSSAFSVSNASAGTYKLVVEIYVSYTLSPSMPMASYTADVTPHGSLSVYGNNKQMVQIGANGFVAHLTGGFSAVIATDPSNGNAPQITLQGMKNGNVIGLRINATDGVQINRGGLQGWEAL